MPTSTSDILPVVIPYLVEEDLALVASGVCKYLRYELNSKYDWTEHLHQCLLQHKPFSDYPELSQRFSKIKSLSLNSEYRYSTANIEAFLTRYGTQLQSLSIGFSYQAINDPFSKKTLPLIIPTLTNLQKLKLDVVTGDAELHDIANRLVKLKSLYICGDFTSKGAETILRKCTNLTALYIAQWAGQSTEREYSWLREGLLSKLKKFGCGSPSLLCDVWSECENISTIRWLSENMIADMNEAELRSSITKRIVPNLSLDYTDSQITRILSEHPEYGPSFTKLSFKGAEFEASIIASLVNITKLHLTQYITVGLDIFKVLSDNCPQLRELSVEMTNATPDVPFGEVSLNFPKLEELSIVLEKCKMIDPFLRAEKLQHARFVEITVFDKEDMNDLPNLVNSLKQCPKLKTISCSENLAHAFCQLKRPKMRIVDLRFSWLGTSDKHVPTDVLETAITSHGNVEMLKWKTSEEWFPQESQSTSPLYPLVREMVVQVHYDTTAQLFPGLHQFSNLVSLRLFRADYINTEILFAISKECTRLQLLDITNNHNPELNVMKLQSKSLAILSTVHCHELENVDFDCPNLHSIQFDNTGKIRVGTYETAHSSFSERALQTICDKNSCPNLMTFYGSPTSDSMRNIFAAALDPVDIRIEHPQLVSVQLYNCPNLQSATFTNCPNLEEVKLVSSDTLKRLEIKSPKLRVVDTAHCPQLVHADAPLSTSD